MVNIKEHTAERMNVNKVGFYSAILTALITLASFLVVKPPISGPFCLESCIEYPYIYDVIAQFPKDYVWMYFLVVLMVVYVVFMASIHYHTMEEKKIFS